ncbi:hypothetical protein ACHAXR_007667 [Thalassiosira sp. AJA248-18]
MNNGTAMAEPLDATNRRRRDQSARHLKELLFTIIAVGCMCFTSIPSVSKYRVLVDEHGHNASTHNDWQRQSISSHTKSGDDELFANTPNNLSPMIYNDAKNDHTGQNATVALPPQRNQSSQMVNASAIPQPLEYNDTPQGNKSHNTTSPHTLQNESFHASNTIVASNIPSPQGVKVNNELHNHKFPANASTLNYSTDIDLVSLTVRDDFFILFNNSAITSWLKYIQNVRSITFIGPSKDCELFHQNMNQHYPHYLISNNKNNSANSISSSLPRIHWVNETHWITTYKNKYRCPYHTVYQQLVKLYVFDLRTQLGLDYIGNNILVVDSDTVWSRTVTFVHPDGKVQYYEVGGTYKSETFEKGVECMAMDPVKFTEGITMGSSLQGPRKATLTPYKACQRPEYPNATGARHIAHHMLFQYDVMMHLHGIIATRWNVPTLWQAFNSCHSHDFCKSRIAEYELYFAFVSENYPERVMVGTLTNNVDYMASSAICDKREMKCCEDRGVLLKGCHDHRIKEWEKYPIMVGDMCCTDKT